MATGDLITNARLQDNLNNYGGTANETTTQNDQITAVSRAIKKFCKRDFVSTSYDELYNGNGGRTLVLRQYPIQSVKSVRYRPVTVLKVINNNTLLNQQARVQITSVDLTLTRVASRPFPVNSASLRTLGFGKPPVPVLRTRACKTSTGSPEGWAVASGPR